MERLCPFAVYLYCFVLHTACAEPIICLGGCESNLTKPFGAQVKNAHKRIAGTRRGGVGALPPDASGAARAAPRRDRLPREPRERAVGTRPRPPAPRRTSAAAQLPLSPMKDTSPMRSPALWFSRKSTPLVYSLTR